MINDDKKLKKGFEEYLSGEKPSYSAVENAKAYMKKREKSEKRAFGMLRFGSVFACVLVLFIAAYSVFAPMFTATQEPIGELNNPPKDVQQSQSDSAKDSENTSDNNESERKSHLNKTYASSELKFKKIEYKAANKLVPLEFIENEREYVAQENYSAYYFKDSDELAFVFITVSFVKEFGREDLMLVIDVSGGSYKELKEYENLRYSGEKNGIDIFGSTTRESGEWVSQAYFITETGKYYLSMTSPNSESYKNILENIGTNA